MAEDAPPPLTLKERMAMLQMNQAPPSYEQAMKRDTPNGCSPRRPLPMRPGDKPDVPPRPQSTGVASNGVANRNIGNLPQPAPPPDASARPPLPARTSTQSSQTPALPPRKQSTPALPQRQPTDSRRGSQMSLQRKTSQDSMTSVNTTDSRLSNGTSMTSRSESFYEIRAPAYDPAALPPLPPKRTEEEKEAARRPFNSRYSSSNTSRRKSETPTPVPAPKQTQPVPTTKQVQPAPPPRPARSQAQLQPTTQPQTQEPPTEPPRRTLPPPAQRPKQSALAMGFGNRNDPPPVPSARPGSVPASNGVPPPIPAASKPDLAALQASKPKPSGATNGAVNVAPPAAGGSCLTCRDFSAPDNHAARFPRQAIPSQDVGWLAHSLCDPFPSHTDKARAIFTWLHHNVAYDVDAFFGNRVKPSTPQDTLASGLAVCEGYAGLFSAIALKAGLEAMVVGGHGKGFGIESLQPGQPVPPYEGNHAWNVVRIDNGEWKLIDCCWGAGCIEGAGKPYQKRFAPERFTQSNMEFGLDHFPDASSNQFRSDGRVVTWDEYMTGGGKGTGPQVCSIRESEEGLSKASFQPTMNPIQLSHVYGPTQRFSFQKVCPHWDPAKNGKAPGYPLFILIPEGGKMQDFVPLERGDGIWWVDVPKQKLGAPGSRVQICSITQFDGQDARGLTTQQFRAKQGRCGMGWASVATWTVAA